MHGLPFFPLFLVRGSDNQPDFTPQAGIKKVQAEIKESIKALDANEKSAREYEKYLKKYRQG
ncbi:MAG: hypothetical protein HQK96_13555 [Nitrospirae bacterium]|nr:hypothetical protein [Nitrospirota bacterium]